MPLSPISPIRGGTPGIKKTWSNTDAPQRMPPGSGAGALPFANPFQQKGWDTGWDKNYLNASPGQAYSQWIDWLGGPRSVKNYMSAQYNNLYGRYGAMQATDPTLKWLDFLAGVNLRDEYGAASPYERGERASMYAPRIRMIGY